MKRLTQFILLLALFAACSPASEKKSNRVALTGIDTSRKPGDDFFMYVNNIWYDSAKIPAGQTGVGSYSFLNYPQRIRLRAILDSLSHSNNPAGSIAQKVGDFYASGMDTAAIDKRGYEPIKPILARMDVITDVPSLLKVVVEEQKNGDGSIIGFYVAPDDKHSTINIAQFYQTGIGLPERDYYFKTDSSTVKIQNAYRKYLTQLFELTGTDVGTAEKNAAIAYGIEKQLASSHRTNIELRDVKANYNKMAVATLAKKHANINWPTLLNDLGAKVDSVNVSQPAYYDKLNALLKSVSIADWKVYLKANALTSYANYLSRHFAVALF